MSAAKAPTRRQLEKRLTDIGYGSLSEEDLIYNDAYGYWEYSLFAPSGFMFYASGVHGLCGSADTKADLYKGILEDIGTEGLVLCDNEDCDGCAEGDS
jgi:hypothetical protein